VPPHARGLYFDVTAARARAGGDRRLAALKRDLHGELHLARIADALPQEPIEVGTSPEC